MSDELHELTERIKAATSTTCRREVYWPALDFEIRAWLEEKITLCCDKPFVGQEPVKKIFALTTPEEVKTGERVKVWPCENISLRNSFWLFADGHGREITVSYYWKVCPICGATRPKQEETLAEKTLKLVDEWVTGRGRLGDHEWLKEELKILLTGKEGQ